MKCPYCGFNEEQNNTTCSRCGNALASTYAEESTTSESPPAEEIRDKKSKSFKLESKEDVTGNAKTELTFYAVPVQKFILLSIATFGYYYLYWSYKNWEVIRKQRQAKINPLGRALFFIFYFIQFGNIVLASAKARGYTKKYTSWVLLVAIIGLNLLVGFFDETESLWYIWPIGFLDVLFFLPIVKAILYNNEKASEPKPANHYSGWEIAILIVGFLFFGLSLLGTVLEALDIFGLGWV